MSGASFRMKLGKLGKRGVRANANLHAGFIGQTMPCIFLAGLGTVRFQGAPCAGLKDGNDGFGGDVIRIHVVFISRLLRGKQGGIGEEPSLPFGGPGELRAKTFEGTTGTESGLHAGQAAEVGN